MIKWIKRFIKRWIREKIAERRWHKFCEAQGHYCPDCVYYKLLWDKNGISFKGDYCLWWKYNYKEDKE